MYSIALIVQKSEKADLLALKKSYDAALKLGMEKKWGVKPPVGLKNPFTDGDTKYPGDPLYANCIIVNAKSDRQPGIVKATALGNERIINPDEFYSGCFCGAFLNAFWYDNEGKGISFGLQHLMFIKDGERLSGRVSVEDAFDADGGVAESDGIPF
jgi:hypothetical protein